MIANRPRIQLEDRAAKSPMTQIEQCSHKFKVKDDSLVVDQTSFVAFICKIINITTKQEKKKSDKIKTVVNAAEEFLSIQDLRAEVIHEILRANNEGGSQSTD